MPRGCRCPPVSDPPFVRLRCLALRPGLRRGRRGRTARGLCDGTSHPSFSVRSEPNPPLLSDHQFGTYLNNPYEQEPTEIEVADPTHPLFGRRFSLLSVSDPNYCVGHVFVSYRGYMVLRIE